MGTGVTVGIEVDGAADGAGVVVGARDIYWEVTAAVGEGDSGSDGDAVGE